MPSEAFDCSLARGGRPADGGASCLLRKANLQPGYDREGQLPPTDAGQ